MTNELLEAIFDTVDALIVVLDRDGCIVRFNRSCENVSGYGFDDVRGEAIWDRLLLPEEADDVRAVFRKLQSGKFPNVYENYWLTKDGNRRLISWSNTCLTDDGGAVEHVIGTGIDITDQREAEDERQRLLAEQNLILDHASLGIFFGKDRNIVKCNRRFEEIFGYGPGELLDKSTETLYFSRDDFEKTGELAGSKIERGEVYKSELQLRKKDGEAVRVYTTARACNPSRLEEGIIVDVLDINDLKRAEEGLTRASRVLRALSACNKALVRASKEEQLLADICRVIVEEGDYRFAWVGFAERDAGKTVRPVAYSGYEAGYLDTARITWADEPRGRGPVGTAIREGRAVAASNIEVDDGFEPWRTEATKRGYGSEIALPLSAEGQVFGSLNVYSAHRDVFDDDEGRMLTELADDLAFGIRALRDAKAKRQAELHRLRLERKRQETLLQTISAIARTVEARDPYTSGHEQRVASLADAIAAEMGYSEERREGIRVAGILHDIGKLQVPMDILNRPDRLSEIEHKLVETHAEVGYEILRGIEFPWPLADIVRQHHERLDGSGYPRGLKEEDILPEARILAVADVVESMASHRPYRPALGVDAALVELLQDRGTRFDAEIVDACVNLFKNKGYVFP